MRASLFFLVFLGCGSEGNLALRTPKLELDVLSPTYGQFLGDGPVVVEGRINEPLATVTVEGRPVDVDAEGRFVTSVPLDYAYRIVDVEAELFGAWTRERVPVFQGQDPLLSWPGGLTVRLTAEGLGRLGEVVGSTIDQTGWDASLLAALPSVDNELFALTPTALTHDPTVVVLTPVDGGVDTAISLRNVAVEMELSIPALGWSVPLSVGYERIEVGALAVPLVDDEGMLSLELTESTVDLADPVFSVAEMEIDLLALALEAASWVVEPIGELVLDLVLGAVGVVPLGGPYVFEADLLGTPIEIRLTEVWGDPWGLGGELAVGLGEPAALLPLDIPAPTAVPPGADLALGLHEGLLQLVVEGAMLGLL